MIHTNINKLPVVIFLGFVICALIETYSGPLAQNFIKIVLQHSLRPAGRWHSLPRVLVTAPSPQELRTRSGTALRHGVCL